MRISSRPNPLLLLVAAMSACAPVAGPSLLGQEAAYTRTPGETLHYREVHELSLRTGMMEMIEQPPTRLVRDARFVIRFTDDDRAQAWVESLRFASIEAPERPRRIAGADVLQQQFTLRIGARGIDSIVAAPALPEPWSEVGTLLRDFFPRLPGGQLARGQEWEDTSTQDLSDSVTTGMGTRRVRYRVVGGGVIGGERVVVTEYELESRSESRLRPEHQPPGDHLPGKEGAEWTRQEERGRIYFAPRTGRFVRRTRSGVQDRTWSVYGSHHSMSLTTEYTGTLDLLTAQGPRPPTP